MPNRFPRDEDITIIRAFLLRAPSKGHYRNDMVVYSSTGGLALSMSEAPFAFFDTAGALMGIPGVGVSFAYSRLAINAIMDELGDAQAKLVREDHGFDTTSPPGDEGNMVRDFRYFFAGQRVYPGQPFVMMGELSMRAYKVSMKGKRNVGL